MRANSTGPRCSAAPVNISAAVRTAGKRRSAAGIVLTRCAMDSRRDASLMPSGSSIGSAKRLSQDTTQIRNGTGIQADAELLVPGKIARLPKKQRPQLVGGDLRPSYSGGLMPEGNPV